MHSIWTDTCAIPERAPLEGDRETQAVVIGAGMAGILIASALQAGGIATVVLEANRIGSGQTRNTTAKITAQHGLVFHKLIQSFGTEQARQYAQANLQAVGQYRTLIRARNIRCDFEECSSFVYGDDLDTLEQEVQAAQTLGMPASLVHECPIPAAGAVRFDNQAQFHPLRFLSALSEDLTIYEQTPVLQVEEDCVITPYGTLKAKYIIFACHFPFLNFPGMFFTKMHQERSYVLALEGAPSIDGMWIGEGEGSISLRQYQKLLLFGGEKHRAGENSAGGRYDRLRKKAQEWFPGSREIAHWSAQDCITADGVPYIGPYSSQRPGWYVATGFQKWGMTTSMAAAALLRDLILDKQSPYAQVFDPGRLKMQTLSGIAVEGGQAVKGLTRRFLQVPHEAVADLPPGHGGIVQVEGEKVGVYKEEDGTIHTVDIRCPHLGCQLEWNPDEKSWDCPCHGSRFDFHGHLISGPAQEDISDA